MTKIFYQEYPDSYDFLAFFPSFLPKQDLIGSLGAHFDVQNQIRGICKLIVNPNPVFWGSSKLKGGHQYPYDNQGYKSWVDNPSLGSRVLLEETAHQWLVKIGKGGWLPPPGNLPGINRSCIDTQLPLLSEDRGHWSNGLQTPNGSVGAMREAVPWVDEGNGVFTFDSSLYDQPRKFHPFDLYIMGLVAPSEVTGDSLLLTDISDASGGQGSPYEMRVNAQSRRININDIIDIAGEPRSPNVSNSQKDFTMAFVILKKPGQEVSPVLIQAINSAAQHFPAQWAFATDNRSTMNK